MKFLVVDDHELIREAMRAALAELDGEAAILEAPDSREAMRLIEEHPDVDLILLDLNLPDRDGFTVLSDLRKSHPAISVVVMSAQQVPSGRIIAHAAITHIEAVHNRITNGSAALDDPPAH
jgi:DNA-binding NarL/FixJ family response regulator